MKKYHKLLILPAFVIIIAGIFSGFSEQSQEQVIKDLLMDRTKIMQRACYGKIEMDRAEKILGRIETYPLLSEDIQNMRNLEASDMDKIKSMEIISIKQKMKMFDYTSYDIEIRWIMDGYEEEYVYENEYSIVVKTSNKTVRLSEFNPKSI